jgi:glycosidase
MNLTTTPHWANASVFYHIYPLGFCGAPARNDFRSPTIPRLEKIIEWIPHLRELGVNAVYLGPTFESTAHGYDTADYYHVDRRLGEDSTLPRVTEELHRNSMRVILDGVFNHVGRDFWAFRDVREQGEASPYRDWFNGLRFDGQSPYGDPFTYEGWNGHYDLIKLNLANPDVKHHLFEAVRSWVQLAGIDGLRLDAADCLDLQFLKELRAFTHTLRPDFWLIGEVVHGDYRRWVNGETLDSVTNFECYKGLYSSHVDRNYFEIAYTLKRQFGDDGLYCDLPLYNFADNHDVDRVASSLNNQAHLYCLYCLLLTIPGVPSIYYGSEWGLEARRKQGDDTPLRPCLDLQTVTAHAPQPDLPGVIAKLAGIRLASPALLYGSYRQLHVSHEQFVFARQSGDERIVVMVNAADHPIPLEIPLPFQISNLTDLLNPGETFPIRNGKLIVDSIPACWARILKPV